jgi:hypothetical protein
MVAQIDAGDREFQRLGESDTALSDFWGKLTGAKSCRLALSRRVSVVIAL